ncbi:pantoate--beta-alanine ligase [Shewanella surugensis]|uniref:Pantothenate synthetase n=1 Tax=Shewanella surugensis TaxID=212020 RepID=A0ABT0L600_9GAMM|nr:pantoate--beta-alanine ligase [Shewanella surugensis]MCL1122994.1 pantoate--beta-alanine ligase [Shewanella surugensis]
MITIHTIDEVRTHIRHWRQKGETVALVMTMGNLHQGHVSLIKAAAQKADHVVASIFVNPMQFGKNEDFDTYPKTLAVDQLALSEAGTALLFAPNATTVYPNGMDTQTFVEVPRVSEELCGAGRPGHFRGVATVVCKFFNIIQPDFAFFGRKDFQQLLVINTMVEDLSLPIEVIGVETMREASGLAMSSRNGYLCSDQKQQAASIKKVMDAMSIDIKQGKALDAVTQEYLQTLINTGFVPEYLEVRNAKNLYPAADLDKELVILVAAKMGSTRLIDNQCVNR